MKAVAKCVLYSLLAVKSAASLILFPYLLVYLLLYFLSDICAELFFILGFTANFNLLFIL